MKYDLALSPLTHSAAAGLVDDLSDHVAQCGVGRFATSVAMSQGGCSPLPVCRLNAPAVDLLQSFYLSLR